MKVVVYAICKNEEKFVAKWIENMSEADQIVVLDTGSTDNTINLLKSYEKVELYTQNFSPWRFDKARNYCLSLVPKDADICVCTDLDEVFTKNWRTQLEKYWEQGKTTIASYKYVWSHNEDGSDGISFYIKKAHCRFSYKWINPVHEVLKLVDNITQCETLINGITLHHFADISKSRSQYLPLLELAVKENPTNDRNMHYLGREYMFYSMYDKSIKTLKKHLKLKSATWLDERCASLRYIAKQYAMLNKNYLANKYYKLAMLEAPHLREPKLEYAEYLFTHKKYADCAIMINYLEQITKRSLTYISMPQCWNEYPYDLASICYYHLKDYTKAYQYAHKAHKLAPNDKRIISNLEFFSTLLNK